MDEIKGLPDHELDIIGPVVEDDFPIIIFDRPTWAEMRQAVEWSKGNYRYTGDYPSIKHGAKIFLADLHTIKLVYKLEKLKIATENYKNAADNLLLAIEADKQVEANVWKDYLHWYNELEIALK